VADGPTTDEDGLDDHLGLVNGVIEVDGPGDGGLAHEPGDGGGADVRRATGEVTGDLAPDGSGQVAERDIVDDLLDHQHLVLVHCTSKNALNFAAVIVPRPPHIGLYTG
jgi:hypothetical protein